MNSMPLHCPSCGRNLFVKRLMCQQCGTEVEGFYMLPNLARLERDDQDFILLFVKASGSLKEMARLLKLSYPTVRNRLDDIIDKLKSIEGHEEHEDG